jgi:large subunit ribosomal protein L22
MNITAQLNDYRQSPRKVRLVANLIRGKKVGEALDILTLTVKRASDPLMSLLNSAIANAKNNFSLVPEDLFVKALTVDGGAILYRQMPRARGVAYAIRKRTSRVNLTLGTKDAADDKKIEAPKPARQEGGVKKAPKVVKKKVSK